MNDKELNHALEQLAEEVPPMPADFHDRWMSAVRAEAEKEAVPAEGTETRNKIVSLNRWTRILSVAAAFVFLIGGTLLYRSQRKTLPALETAVANEQKEATFVSGAVNEAVEEAAEAPAAGALPDKEAAEPVMFGAVSYEAAEEDAACDSAVYEAAAYEAEEAEEEAYEKAAEADYDAGEADRAYSAKSVSGEAMNMTAAEAPAAEVTAEPTAAPTAEPTEAPTEAPTAEPSDEKTGFLSETGAFFADMGDFLLAALPYLAVLAVPAAIALIIRRKKK